MPLLTTAQAAHKLAISPRHFRRKFVNTGLIRVISLGSSTRGDRFTEEDVTALIQKQAKCYTNAEKSGGSGFSIAAKKYADPLGLPKGKKQPSSSVRSALL